MPKKKNKWLLLLLFVLLVATFFRSTGLYRGLEEGYIVHPDAPKQIEALHNYLENEYIWYCDSLFYDGYPLFLNHFDEWIIRGVNFIQSSAYNLTHTDTRTISPLAKRKELIYFALTLRAIYGIVTVLLCFVISQKLGMAPSFALLASLLLAMSPISIAVTHAVSGDIGIDLFLVLMMPFLIIYNRTRKISCFFGAGFLTAFAFAAKYQGALLSIIIILYSLLMFFGKEIKIGQVIKAGLLSMLGFLVGVFVAIPQLIWAWDQTIKDIMGNFRFISAYGANPKILARPFMSRFIYSISHNTPLLTKYIGLSIIIFAIIGTAFSIRDYIKCLKKEVSQGQTKDVVSLRLSFFIFPFIATVISLAGKLEIQTFHFSYTLIPLCIATGYAVYRLWNTNRIGMLASILCTIWLLLESAYVVNSDAFFWRRDDTKYLADNYRDTIFEKDLCYNDSDIVRKLYVENDNASVFRNLHYNVSVANGNHWNELGVLSSPCVPLPFTFHWLFMDGPTFPVNDRMFVVEPDQVAKRHLVYNKQPDRIELGIRTGEYPSRLDINVSGKHHKADMAPNHQMILDLPINRWRLIKKHTQKDKDIYLVPISVLTKTGKAWVTAISCDKDEDRFDLFGGFAPKDSSLLDALKKTEDIEEYKELLDSTRFLSSKKDYSVLIRKSKHPLNYLFENKPIPCGVYNMEVEFGYSETPATVCISMINPVDLTPVPNSLHYYKLNKNMHSVNFTITKPFAPYECSMMIECITGKARITGWTFKPDNNAIITDLRNMAKEKSFPDWLAPCPDIEELDRKEVRNQQAVFNNGVTITRIELPDKIVIGEPFSVIARARVKNFTKLDIAEDKAIFRLAPDGDEASPCTSALIWRLLYSTDESLILAPPRDIKPGTYHWRVGIINSRTRWKFRMTSESIPADQKGHAWMNLGDVKVVRAESCKR